jgi:hypothetical protein
VNLFAVVTAMVLGGVIVAAVLTSLLTDRSIVVLPAARNARRVVADLSDRSFDRTAVASRGCRGSF